MSFFRQVKYEIRNILRSKFLLVIGILILVASVAIPIIGLFTNQNPGYIDGPIKPYATTRSAVDMKYGGYYPGGFVDPNLESITVDGIVIRSDNPFYWNIQSLLSEQQSIETDTSRFTEPQAVDLMLELIDGELNYYVQLAQAITTYQDYRMDLSWRGVEYIYDLFFYGHADEPEKALLEVSMYRKGMDPESFRAKYIAISAQERLDEIAKIEDNLTTIYAIVKNDDFTKYIDMRIKQENDQIASLKENIAIQEQAIIDNPSQEENINAIIEDLKRQIQLVETNNIPLLQYRLAKNIKPGIDIWQNRALSDIENSRNQLTYMRILTEKEYNEGYNGQPGIIREEGGRQTYQEYVAAMQKQIDNLNKTIIVAQKSLDTDKPDMKYVPNGPRSRTIQFLDYSLIVALFGVLLGGWLIASEYQQGTIRLLMIRPKTRIKILSAKFVAALLIAVVIDLTGSLLNFITNGICYGFTDYSFPNYTVTGATGFIAYFLPKLIICLIPIVFAFTIAFMLSVVVKNIAVSIIVPISLFIASTIIMGILTYSYSRMTWLAYTPIPFIQISSFFQQNSMVQQMMQNGFNLSLPYGIILLLVLSVCFTFISVLVFKKRDIVN